MRIDEVQLGEKYVIAPSGSRIGDVRLSACWTVRALAVVDAWPAGQRRLEVQPLRAPQHHQERHTVVFPGLRRKVIPARVLLGSEQEVQACRQARISIQAAQGRTDRQRRQRDAGRTLAALSGSTLVDVQGSTAVLRADDLLSLAALLEEHGVHQVRAAIHAAV